MVNIPDPLNQHHGNWASFDEKKPKTVTLLDAYEKDSVTNQNLSANHNLWRSQTRRD